MDDLLNTAPCGFLSFSDDARITIVNATLLDLLGYRREELVGEPIVRLLTPGTQIFYQTHFFPLIRLHGRADEIFLMLRHADGSEVGMLVNAIRLIRDGVPANDCVFMRVVERQKYEHELLLARRAADEARRQMEAQRDALAIANEELDRLRATAEQASRAKSDFLAVMSHELRTPLNAIGGYTHLLAMGVQGPVNDQQRDSLQRIDQSQHHVLRLINEILDLARIESGHISYTIVDFDVDELMHDVLPLVEPQLRQKSLQLEVDVPSQTRVRADREKLVQIMLNLLSNAIKFTPALGSIEISAQHDAASNVVIRIRDSGIGIPATMLNSIFEPFVRVEGEHTQRTQGTGLGLAISRELARGMGGDLDATSAEGVGSTFVLSVPDPANGE